MDTAKFKPAQNPTGVGGLFQSMEAGTQYVVLAPNKEALRRIMRKLNIELDDKMVKKCKLAPYLG